MAKKKKNGTSREESNPLLGSKISGLGEEQSDTQLASLDKLIQHKLKHLPGTGFKAVALVGGAIIGYAIFPFYKHGVENFFASGTASRVHRVFDKWPGYDVLSSIAGNGTINWYAATDSSMAIRDMGNAAKEPAEIEALQKKSSPGYLVFKWGGGIFLITLTSALLYGGINFVAAYEAKEKTPVWLNLVESGAVFISTVFLNFLAVNVLEQGFKDTQKLCQNLQENLGCNGEKTLTRHALATEFADAVANTPDSSLNSELSKNTSETNAIVVTMPDKPKKTAWNRASEATAALIKIPLGTVAAAAILYSNVGLNCDSTGVVRDYVLNKMSDGATKVSLSVLGGAVVLAGGQNFLCIISGYKIGSTIVDLGSAVVGNLVKLAANGALKLYGSDTRYQVPGVSKDTAVNLLALATATAFLLRSGGTAAYLATECSSVAPFSSIPGFPTDLDLNLIYNLTNVFNIFWAQESLMYLGKFFYNLFCGNTVTATAEVTKKAVSAASDATLLTSLSSVFQTNRQKVANMVGKSVEQVEQVEEVLTDARESFSQTARKSSCVIV